MIRETQDCELMFRRLRQFTVAHFAGRLRGDIALQCRRACPLHKLQHIVRIPRLNADLSVLTPLENGAEFQLTRAVAELSWRTLFSASAYLIDGSVN
jgi:hypothetical protein